MLLTDLKADTPLLSSGQMHFLIVSLFRMAESSKTTKQAMCVSLLKHSDQIIQDVVVHLAENCCPEMMFP